MTVRMRGALPAEEMNGLARIESALTSDPKSKRIVVGVIDVAQRRDHGDGVFEPTIEFLQVELLEGKFRERGVKLLQAAYGRRTGARQLDGFAEDDVLDDDSTVDALPATVPPVPGPRYTFEPSSDGKWWIVLTSEDGEVLAKQGGLAVQSDLTLGLLYTLEAIDSMGDQDLSVLARRLRSEADDAEFESSQPEQVSQYVSPDGVDEASAYGGEPDENEDGDEPSDEASGIFSHAKETKEA